MPMACGRHAGIGGVCPTYDDLDWSIGAVNLRDALLGAEQTMQYDSFAYPTLIVPLDVADSWQGAIDKEQCRRHGG